MPLDAFSTQSDMYARYRPDYPEELLAFVLSKTTRRAAAWDCATGNGQIAVRLAAAFDDVVASDISRQQIGHAPAKANIRYVVCPAEATDFAEHQFDLITVAQAIHWFDVEAFYREVRRTARPGAVIAIIGYGRIQVHEGVDPYINQLYEDAFATYFTENRMLLDAHYTTLPFPFEELRVPQFEQPYRWSLADLEGYFNSWSAVQKMKEAGSDPVDGVMRKVRSQWGDAEKQPIRFPVFCRLGRIAK